MRRLLFVVLLALSTTAAARQQPAPIGPNDAIGFDYEVAAFESALVIGFEAQWDGAAWTPIGIPPIVAEGAPQGWNTYKVIPPFTSGVHTVLFRACNAQGCGGSSSPFAFAWINTVEATPTNVRRIPR